MAGAGAGAGDGDGDGDDDYGDGEKQRGGANEIAPKRLFTTSGTGMSSSKSFGSFQPTKTPARSSKQQAGRTPGPGPGPGPSVKALPISQTPLPSASKPRRSSRRSTSISLTPAPPRVLETKVPEQQYATPAPKQRGWDEGDSLGSISEGMNELAISGGLGEVVEEEEEDGEVEYMPPRSIRKCPSLGVGSCNTAVCLVISWTTEYVGDRAIALSLGPVVGG